VELDLNGTAMTPALAAPMNVAAASLVLERPSNNKSLSPCFHPYSTRPYANALECVLNNN